MNQKVKNGIKNTLIGTGITVFVIWGMFFIVAESNKFLQDQHEQFRRETREEFEKALAKYEREASLRNLDTIVYQNKQKTK